MTKRRSAPAPNGVLLLAIWGAKFGAMPSPYVSYGAFISNLVAVKRLKS